MSIYTRGEPAANQQFRQNTEKRAGSFDAVNFIPRLAKCICCGKQRTEATGRRGKSGFVCNGCGRRA